jgi:hypothetical protein
VISFKKRGKVPLWALRHQILTVSSQEFKLLEEIQYMYIFKKGCPIVRDNMEICKYVKKEGVQLGCRPNSQSPTAFGLFWGEPFFPLAVHCSFSSTANPLQL